MKWHLSGTLEKNNVTEKILDTKNKETVMFKGIAITYMTLFKNQEIQVINLFIFHCLPNNISGLVLKQYKYWGRKKMKETGRRGRGARGEGGGAEEEEEEEEIEFLK